MDLNFSWLDLVLVTLLGAIVALGAKRGLLGLVTGALGLLLWAFANVFGGLHPIAGFLVAAGAGFLVAYIGRNFLTELMQQLSDIANQAAGGVGGFLLGFGLICAIAMSFPIRDNPVSGRPEYPSGSLPVWVGEAVRGSAMTKWLTSSEINIWRSPLNSLIVPDRK